MPLPTDGLKAIMSLDKNIETDVTGDPTGSISKYVKLRFTRKQYDAFRNACNIFEIISEYPDFNGFVQRALDGNVKMRTITSQLVHPILDAPNKILDSALNKSLKQSRKDSLVIAGETHVPKITYFTTPIQATDVCKRLYEKVAKQVDGETKYNVLESGTTCITDIRKMISRYITSNDLRTPQGTVFDNFMQTIAYRTFENCSSILDHIGDSYVIPKGDRKVITQIVNEIAFDK